MHRCHSVESGGRAKGAFMIKAQNGVKMAVYIGSCHKGLLRAWRLGRTEGQLTSGIRPMPSRVLKSVAILFALVSLSACGGGSGLFGRISPAATQERDPTAPASQPSAAGIETGDGQTIWDAFGKKNNEANVQVNRYLWAASLDVLSFMPVQSVDPFSGVIVFGYGTPPGGGKAYRATVYIQDPALDARSLNVALAGRGGPVAAGTQRAVEDAILNRARQMRIADGKL